MCRQADDFYRVAPPVRGGRSAVVRLALHDRGNARVNRRAVLLRACAVAALTVQPALAAPSHDSLGSLASAAALADHGPTATPAPAAAASPTNEAAPGLGNGKSNGNG